MSMAILPDALSPFVYLATPVSLATSVPLVPYVPLAIFFPHLKFARMKIENLLSKPVWQMTGEELLFLSRHSADTNTHKEPIKVTPNEKHYVYGIAGICEIFSCSKATAIRIKKSGVIDKAITQVGRKIVIDADLALHLASANT